tara:strand:+ start:93 stop:545 length:453 start_codon:yes stop_codon:yes gene_type:complete
MTASELKEKIKILVKRVYKEKAKGDDAAIAYDELVKFPELKAVIIDLLTVDFDKFLESIDWIAPRPTTFRINLLNGENFVLIFDPRSFIAKVSGKKYYLLNLDEEEMAAKAIARLLSHGAKTDSGNGADVDGAEDTTSAPPEETEETPET